MTAVCRRNSKHKQYIFRKYGHHNSSIKFSKTDDDFHIIGKTSSKLNLLFIYIDIQNVLDGYKTSFAFQIRLHKKVLILQACKWRNKILNHALSTFKQTAFLLVGQLEFVPFQLLRGQSVALVPGKVKYVGPGIFADPNDQNARHVSFFLGQKNLRLAKWQSLWCVCSNVRDTSPDIVLMAC